MMDSKDLELTIQRIIRQELDDFKFRLKGDIAEMLMAYDCGCEVPTEEKFEEIIEETVNQTLEGMDLLHRNVQIVIPPADDDEDDANDY